jgi:molybdopterin synthase sulfur carrier subunit
MRVKFFATYRELTGCKETNLVAPTDVLALLDELALRYGTAMRKKLFTESGEISYDAILLVNGRNISHLSGAETPLSDKDEVSLFPMVAGG